MKSKRRSARSSRSTKPPELVFFIDRSLGRDQVADALPAAGARVEVHDDHVSSNAPDEEWMALAARHGWVALTKDDRIRYHRHELQRFMEAGLRVFVLASGSLRGEEMAAAFVAALPRMRRIATALRGALVARITRHGTVNIISRE